MSVSSPSPAAWHQPWTSWVPALPTNRPTSALEHSGLLSQPLWNQEPSTKGSISASGQPKPHSQPCQEPVPPTSRATLDPGHPALQPSTLESASMMGPQGAPEPPRSAASCPVTQPHPTVTDILPTRQRQGPDTHSRFLTAVSPPQQKDACSPHRGHP